MPLARPRLAVPALAALALAGCASDRPPALVASAKVPVYADPTAATPHIRFDGTDESLNDRCPVRKGKLNLKMPPVYVNGRPVGCC